MNALSMPGAESTSAALRRVEQERDSLLAHNTELVNVAHERDDARGALAVAIRERDSLARRCAVRFEETAAARAELVSARTELDAVRTTRDRLDRELGEARRLIAAMTQQLADLEWPIENPSTEGAPPA